MDPAKPASDPFSRFAVEMFIVARRIGAALVDDAIPMIGGQVGDKLTMLADTPLVNNLDNPTYLEILLDGKENLVELFAELGPSSITNAVAESQSETDRLLPGFRALINNPTLPDQVAQLFNRHLEQSKSN